jgi:hypothetical protein
VSSLTAHRKRTPVSQTTIASDIHQPLDVHLDSFSKIAFDFTLRFEDSTNAAQFVFAQILYARIVIYTRFLKHRI